MVVSNTAGEYVPVLILSWTALAGAASTRVANELGEGKPGAAKTAVKVIRYQGIQCGRCIVWPCSTAIETRVCRLSDLDI